MCEGGKCKTDRLKECSFCKEVLNSKCSNKECRKEGPPTMNTVAGKETEKQTGSKERGQHILIMTLVRKAKLRLVQIQIQMQTHMKNWTMNLKKLKDMRVNKYEMKIGKVKVRGVQCCGLIKDLAMYV